MSRSTKAFIVCVVVAAHAALLQPQSSFAQTASAQISADVQAACASDVQNLCSGVPAGRGTNHRLPQTAQRRGFGWLQTGHPCRDGAIERRCGFCVRSALPQLPVRLRLRSSTTTRPVLRRTLHRVRRVNRRVQLLQLRQPSQESIIF